jgi:hypothetical protein
MPGWMDADGDTCAVLSGVGKWETSQNYGGLGKCKEESHYDYAVAWNGLGEGVSAHEACRTSCPDLCSKKPTLHL